MCAGSLRLGQHRVLAPNARLHVSPLQFGGTGASDDQDSEGGEIDKDTAFRLLDAFHEAGGNFIDAQKEGLTEEYVGEWAEERHIRDQLVIATKYSTNLKHHRDEQNTQHNGNAGVDSMLLSLDASLKNLRTSYIDIFYVDSWEWNTSVEEVMDHLHHLVVARKVFNLGLSNTPTWICSKANMYARVHGKTPFVIYQGSWDVFGSAFQRDVVPMAQAEGMALSLRNIASVGNMKSRSGNDDDGMKKIFHSLDKVSKEVGVEHASTIVVAYISKRIPHAFPVIGVPTTEQLFANVKGLEIHLSSEQISCLESAVVCNHARALSETRAANHSPSDINGRMDQVTALHSIVPGPVDMTAVAHAWLKDFIDITASGDAHGFATKLFKPDGWFRDVLIFSWDNRTLHGHEKIIHYLEKKLATANITKVTLDETPALRPSTFTLPFGQGIEFSFRFETPIALARGLARLQPTSPSGMKALSVFVTMDDLKGYEESGSESGLYGGHTITWNEVLEERRSKVESDPQVVIVGSGQSGLNVAARLKQMNIPALVVEKNQRIGDNWRKRYPSLTLHTPRLYNTMLYQPFPNNFPLYVPRDKLADWFEHYATAQDLVVWTNSHILPKVTYDSQEKRWTMQVNRNGTTVVIRPKHIVLATGVHGFPHIPSIPHSETFRGEVLHTSQFTGGQKFVGLRVVVIGAGNSSADICQDLSFRGAASVTMVQRSKTCVVSSGQVTKVLSQAYPDDLPVEISDFKKASFPIGIVRMMARANMEQVRVVDKDMLEGLQKASFRYHYGEDGSGTGILYLSRGGGYWLDVGCAELIASGKVAVRQGVEPVSFTPTGIVFNDGTELEADAVIFATGYTSWRDRMKDIFEAGVIESTKEIWGLDEEDELYGVFRPTGYPALWYAAGDFSHSRYYSKLLALHIKAEELNLKGS